MDLLDDLLDFISIYNLLSLDILSPKKRSDIQQKESRPKMVIQKRLLTTC